MSMSIGGIILNDPKLPLKIGHYQPALRTEFESNDIELRQLDTRERRVITFEWGGANTLSHAQKIALEALFKQNKAALHTVVLPFGQGTITNMYVDMDTIDYEMIVPNIPAKGIPGQWGLSLKMGES